MSLNPYNDWQAAADLYVELTGAKTPSAPVSRFFKTHHEDLLKAIKKVQEAGEPGTGATAKSYMKAWEDFRKQKLDYVKHLQSLIDEESKNPENKKNGGDPAKTKTAGLRGLKMLKAKLENYDSQFEGNYRLREQTESGLDKVGRAMASLHSSIVLGLARFTAASKTIKAKPTVEVWRKEFTDQDAVRSLTTALKNFKILETAIAQNEGAQAEMPREVMQSIPLAKTWITKLSPWADGAKRQLEPGDDVLKELAVVTKQVKECANQFEAWISPGKVPYPSHFH